MNQNVVLENLEATKWLKTREIAEKTGFSMKNLTRQLRALRQFNIIDFRPIRDNCTITYEYRLKAQ